LPRSRDADQYLGNRGVVPIGPDRLSGTLAGKLRFHLARDPINIDLDRDCYRRSGLDRNLVLKLNERRNRRFDRVFGVLDRLFNRIAFRHAAGQFRRRDREAALVEVGVEQDVVARHCGPVFSVQNAS
jgi:hypothetical protein